MTTGTTIKLHIPRQDLAVFSAFEPNTEGAQAWTQALPITNTRGVAQQLREAIAELNRVSVAPDTRFTIMETLRPNLLIALSALSGRFLKQTLVLPEEARQLSELAGTLNRLATTAYTLVAIQAIQQRKTIQSANPARLVCEALQRALNFAGRNILQSYQLYQPIEPDTWLEMNQLYALAERQQLANLPVGDKLFGDGSIAQAYLRAVLLSCCKPNQLRQGDLAGIYKGLQLWREYARLEDPEAGDGLFQVDLDDDRPPRYSALFADAALGNCRYIDTVALVEHLASLKEEDDREGKPGIALDDETHLPSNILEHLIGALGTMTKRHFARAESSNTLFMALGLSNAHYFIAGGLTFDQLLHGAMNDENERSASNPFMAPAKHHDAWEEANPHEDARSETGEHIVDEIIMDETTIASLEHLPIREPARDRHQAYPVGIVNAGPGGYCLEWSSDLPGDIRTGEIVCVRDGEAADWVVAVTRWVSQLRNARTLVGIELLSPTAMPYGARVLHTSGEEAELMRVLLLPEIKLVGQPHTLITPRTGFRERQKVSLVREGEQFYLQLLRQVSATASFAQFDFRYIKLLEDVIAKTKSGALSTGYDSVWTKI